MACDPDIAGSAHWAQHISTHTTTKHQTSHPVSPYSPSTASTTSSSDSVFSIDAPSSQSSEAASEWSSSDRSEWINDNDIQYQSSHRHGEQVNDDVGPITFDSCPKFRAPPRADAVAPESRQHPRRTQRLDSYQSQDGDTIVSCPRPPPSLVRQSERKDNFVDSLVDTTTQMIEIIWPISVLSCGRDSAVSGRQQSVLGLRTFVQEVLRRSKTSYSTLQVALYYLILIQSCVPKHDFTMEQSEDSSACRAMQCGRRMFLAALILASKYLQDRNYSARAWSKISGLKTYEINTNEMAFLKKVNWKLHIPEHVFHRWTDIVLKYSPSAQVNALPRSTPIPLLAWRVIVPLLTPELDNLPFELHEAPGSFAYSTPGPTYSDMSPPPVPVRAEKSPSPESDEVTPTNPFRIPKTLEPTPRDTRADEHILPPLPRLGPLPTPQMTPQTGTFCTPAVSASGLGSGRSMSHAMAIQNNCLARSTLDNPHQWQSSVPPAFPRHGRRSSLSRSISTISSPESMISDSSSRSSRSSSISSVASSNCALPLPRMALAAQATRRCANMQLSGQKKENRPLPSLPVKEHCASWVLSETPPTTWGYPEPQTYHGTSFHEPHDTTSYYSQDTREAATALRDLHLNRQQSCTPKPVPHPQTARKRARPNSMDLSVQSSVRELIAPRCLGDITNRPNPRRNEDDSIVLPDPKPADSFLVARSGNSRPTSSHSNNKPALSGECLPRKRTCAGSDRGGREEARMMMQRLKEMENTPRAGLWGEVVF